jgi:hypothetical protein
VGRRGKMGTIKCAAWNIGRGFFKSETEIKDLAMREDLDIISIIEADIIYQTNPPTIEGFKTVPTLRSSPLQKVRLLTYYSQ